MKEWLIDQQKALRLLNAISKMKTYQKGGNNRPYFPKPGGRRKPGDEKPILKKGPYRPSDYPEDKPVIKKGPFKPIDYPKDKPIMKKLQSGGTNSRTRNVEARQKSRATRQTARQEQRTERARVRANDPRSLKEKIFGNTAKRNTSNYTPKSEESNKGPKTAPLNIERKIYRPTPEDTFKPNPEKFRKYVEEMPKRKEFQKGGTKKKPSEMIGEIARKATTSPRAMFDMGKKAVKKVQGKVRQYMKKQDGGATMIPRKPGHYSGTTSIVTGGTERQRNKYAKKVNKGMFNSALRPNEKATKYAKRKGLKVEHKEIRYK